MYQLVKGVGSKLHQYHFSHFYVTMLRGYLDLNEAFVPLLYYSYLQILFVRKLPKKFVQKNSKLMPKSSSKASENVLSK